MNWYKFAVEDIKKFSKSMVVLVDSRERKNAHILDYFDRQGIAHRTEKLEYGDYRAKLFIYFSLHKKRPN